MSNKIVIRKKINSRVGIAAILAGLWYGSTAAIAGNFVEPPVFASAKGVLDLLMIATPPNSEISFTPPVAAQLFTLRGGFMKVACGQRQIATNAHRAPP